MIIIDSQDIKHRRYLNLEFEYIVICADDMTYKEKSESYDTFSNEISNKDKKVKVNIKVIIPDVHTKNIIDLANVKNSRCIIFLDKFIFIILLLITLEQLYKCIFWNLYVKKITILKVISNYYDLTLKNSSFNIQPVVKLFGEDIKFDREKYAFKYCEGFRNYDFK